jgi:glucosamine-6-phosphate deaminase
VKYTVLETYEDMSRYVAEHVAEVIRKKKNAVLGLATGSTPIGLYQYLIRMYQEGNLDFSQVTTFNLDEYVGLSKKHSQSYHAFMDREFFNHININRTNVYIPNGDVDDLSVECRQYEQLIQQEGGIDLQILGIGANGHIGFNEPGSLFEGTTRIVELDNSTLQANARFFESVEKVPKKAISMGIRTILNSRLIFLIASGKGKAQAVRQMLKGDMTTRVPASLLQNHQGVYFFLDQAAASELQFEQSHK